MPRTTKEWIGRTPNSQPPTTVLIRIFEECGGHCAACGIKIGPKKWEADHKTRLKDGGENRESNLQVLCILCHREKTGKENSDQAKANRVKALTLGIKKRKKSRFRGWRRMDGTIVWNDKD